MLKSDMLEFGVKTDTCSFASRWTRMTIPLPLAARTKYTRFRWSQRERSVASSWALDNGSIDSISLTEHVGYEKRNQKAS